MKDLFNWIKDYGIKPLTETVGWCTLALFVLTLIPSLSFLSKNFVLFVVLPWVLGH